LGARYDIKPIISIDIGAGIADRADILILMADMGDINTKKTLADTVTEILNHVEIRKDSKWGKP